MNIYLKLILVSLLPVLMSILLYFVFKHIHHLIDHDKRTDFKGYKFCKVINGFWVKNVIIGVIFGCIAIYTNHVNVKVTGLNGITALANCRDAAVLCAGLIFGGPAGIIAGLIGGIERACLGGYSVVACSISTIIAGFYSAALRRFIFDKKVPAGVFGLAVAVIMEVIHLFIFFLTKSHEPAKVLSIIEVVCFPMLFANAFAVFVPCLVIQIYRYFTKGIKEQKKYRNLTKKFQTYMFLAFVVCFCGVFGVTWVIENNITITSTSSQLKENIDDVKNDVGNTALTECEEAIAFYNTGFYTLPQICEIVGVTDINIVVCDPDDPTQDGKIIYSSKPEYVGFNMLDKPEGRTQSYDFHKAMTDAIYGDVNKRTYSYIQSYMPMAASPSIKRKFAAKALQDYTKYLQIGYDYTSLHDLARTKSQEITGFRHVGNYGFILVMDEMSEVLSCHPNNDIYYVLKDNGERVRGNEVMITPDVLEKEKPSTFVYGNIYEVDCCYMYEKIDDFYIVVAIPTAEVTSQRSVTMYIISFLEVIIFSILYVLIYFLIQNLVVKHIYYFKEGLFRIAEQGNLDIKFDDHSCNEFSDLSKDINSTVTRLNGMIDEAKTKNEKEMLFAKNIQLSTLPNVFPPYPNVKQFDIYATMDAAREVGGDFYDFYMVDLDHFGFCVADVSGKGITAAMVMMEAKTMLRNLTKQNKSPSSVLATVNDSLCNENCSLFITCWLGVLNIRTGEVVFANAGHNKPIIIHPNGVVEEHDQKRIPPLSTLPGLTYIDEKITLKPGDRIYLYTDGVTEANDKYGNMYGIKRLMNYISRNHFAKEDELLLGLKQNLDTFAKGLEQFDDITMLIVDYKGSGIK